MTKAEQAIKTQVRMLAISIGIRPAARQLQLNEDTVCSWAARDKANGEPWTIEPQRNTPAATQASAINPADKLVNVITERKETSRAHLSKYVVKASRAAAKHKEPLTIAQDVRHVAAVHTAVWPEPRDGGNTTLNLDSLNIQINNP